MKAKVFLNKSNHWKILSQNYLWFRNYSELYVITLVNFKGDRLVGERKKVREIEIGKF